MNKLSFDSASETCIPSLAKALLSLSKRETKPAVILCVGSDRLTGDSLGPLVGYHLTRSHNINAFVYGTLDCPVTAKNLLETSEFIKTRHPRCRVLVVDASLGCAEDVGVIRLSRGGINPGAGVNKVLPRVGDVSITAVVNVLSDDRKTLLAATHLSLVYKLSLLISQAIAEAFKIKQSISAILA